MITPAFMIILDRNFMSVQLIYAANRTSKFYVFFFQPFDVQGSPNGYAKRFLNGKFIELYTEQNNPSYGFRPGTRLY